MGVPSWVRRIVGSSNCRERPVPAALLCPGCPAVSRLPCCVPAALLCPGCRQRNDRGMPRPKMAIRSRWISLVPPPNVRMTRLRAYISSRPARTASGVPRWR